MTADEKKAVLDAARAAREAGRTARAAAKAAAQNPFRANKAAAAHAALEAFRAAQAAQDAALGLDPDEALEDAGVWETHCLAMGAAEFARTAADAAMARA